MDGAIVARFGQLHPEIAASKKLRLPAGTEGVYIAELYLDRLYEHALRQAQYEPLPRFPAVERDLALLCAADLPVAEIESAIRNGGGNLLTQTALFDVYQGAQIAAGQKSVAYRLTFQSNEGTLTDEQLNPVLKKIFRKLEEKGCQLRG
jgi:phenylalanyl-tRNA synthetase beta chain